MTLRTTTGRYCLAACFGAVVLCASSAWAMPAGASRFMPLDQSALRSRTTLIERKDTRSAEPAPARPDGNLSRGKYMRLNRDVLTLSTGLAKREKGKTMARAARHPASARRTPRGVEDGLDIVNVTETAADNDDAVLMLFDDREIDKAHPFNK